MRRVEPCSTVNPVTSPSFVSRGLARTRRRLVDVQATLAVDQDGSGPRRADWVYAGLFLLLGILEGLTDVETATMPGLQVLVAVIAAAGVPWRRVRPPYAMVAAVALFTVASGLNDDVDFSMTAGAFFAIVFQMYAVTRWRPERDVILGVAAVVILDPVGAFLRTGLVADLIANFTLWTLVAATGLVMRYRRVLQLNQVEQARLSERNVLARELHDSVAHYVSAIAVQAQAAQFVAMSDPAAALRSMAEVERTANRAIDEMRLMVGVLRTSDDIARTVASTSLLDLVDPALRPQVSVTGVSDLSQLSAPVAAATFRVAQEAVTNARKHAPQARFINVDCTVTADEVVLQVANDGSSSQPDGGGYGLIGMEERVAALGGRLMAGPTPDRGWNVVARIPRDTTTTTGPSS